MTAIELLRPAPPRALPLRLLAPLAAAARDFAVALVLPVLILILWSIGSAYQLVPQQILPPPAYVLENFRDMLASGELLHHAGISAVRVAAGFAVGASLGLVLGIAMGLYEAIDDYVRPLFTAIAQVPALGWIPLLMLFLGIGEALKIVIIAKAALVPMVLNTSAGIRGVPRSYMEVTQVFGFTRWQQLRRLILPAAVPPIFTGIRYSLTKAWTALVAVELLASAEGLGYLLVWGRQMFWLDTMIVAMIIIGVVGFAMDKILALFEARLQSWRIDA